MRTAGLVGLLLLFAAPLLAQDYPLLRESRQLELQAALNQTLDQLGLSTAVRERRLAVTLVDLADPARPQMAGVNGRVMFYSASLPKIAILLGAYQRIEDGELQLTPALSKDLHAMIRRSSNPAATRVLDRVGRDYLSDLLMSERYALYDPDFNGGLWVGKPYGSEQAYQRDPLHGISHGASSLQVARFYYLLETGRLVSPAASAQMRATLADPAIRHKFVKGLTQRFSDVKIFRKSGTWRDYHSDSAIVEHDGKRYIIVALSHDPQGSKWLEQLALALDRLVSAPPPAAPAVPRRSVPGTDGPDSGSAQSTAARPR